MEKLPYYIKCVAPKAKFINKSNNYLLGKDYYLLTLNPTISNIKNSNYFNYGKYDYGLINNNDDEIKQIKNVFEIRLRPYSYTKGDDNKPILGSFQRCFIPVEVYNEDLGDINKFYILIPVEQFVILVTKVSSGNIINGTLPGKYSISINKGIIKPVLIDNNSKDSLEVGKLLVNNKKTRKWVPGHLYITNTFEKYLYLGKLRSFIVISNFYNRKYYYPYFVSLTTSSYSSNFITVNEDESTNIDLFLYNPRISLDEIKSKENVESYISKKLNDLYKSNNFYILSNQCRIYLDSLSENIDDNDELLIVSSDNKFKNAIDLGEYLYDDYNIDYKTNGYIDNYLNNEIYNFCKLKEQSFINNNSGLSNKDLQDLKKIYLSIAIHSPKYMSSSFEFKPFLMKLIISISKDNGSLQDLKNITNYPDTQFTERIKNLLKYCGNNSYFAKAISSMIENKIIEFKEDEIEDLKQIIKTANP